jgi:hypothetical protein
LNEFREQNIACEPGEYLRDDFVKFRMMNNLIFLGTVIRAGCQPPNEHQLSEYFLDHLVLQELVQKLKLQPNLQNSEAKKTEEKIVKNGKIFICTLNYSASSRLRQLISKVGFIIVDEGIVHQY